MDFSDHAKQSYITRNVNLSRASQVIDQQPASGDLLLCRVDRIRQHTRLENIHGRREHLYEGDQIIVVAAERYATGQFSSALPTSDAACHLIAAGGIAGHVTHRSRQVKAPTELTLIGVIADSLGKPLNLSAFSPLSTLDTQHADIPVLVVIGSDMNAGKTTTVCAGINGFTGLGLKVAGAKLTGTGAGPDYWRMWDAGACHVVDFVDAGLPTTVGRSIPDFIDLVRRFKASAIQAGAQVLVLEIADGILQPETRALINAPRFINEISGVLIAAESATSAVMVSERVIQAGFPVYGISGLFTRSPLACEEAAQGTGLPIFTPSDLVKPHVSNYLHNAVTKEHESAYILAG